MADNSTTLLPGGLSTAAIGSALSTYTNPDATKNYVWFDDFSLYTAANWIVTETQGAATQAIVNGNGGILALVNSAANNDLNAIQWANETFRFAPNKKAWFKTRFKVDDVSLAQLAIGLQITDDTPLAVTDGVYFSKTGGNTSLIFNVVKDSAATTTTIANALADDTYVDVGFAYDGNGTFVVYLNNNALANVPATNLPDDEDLTVSVAVANGSGAARTLSVDYVFAANER